MPVHSLCPLFHWVCWSFSHWFLESLLMDINPLLLNMFANIFSQSVIYVVFSHIKFLKKCVCSICQSFPLWLLGFVLHVKRPLPLILLYLFKYLDIISFVFHIGVFNSVGISFSCTVWHRSPDCIVFKLASCPNVPLIWSHHGDPDKMGGNLQQGPALTEIAFGSPGPVNYTDTVANAPRVLF